MTETDATTVVKRLDMRVAAKVLQQLASGIYRSPAGSIKELVSNSFDADAKRVDIKIQIDERQRKVDKIVVKDRGCGMDFAEFEWFSTHIGTSLKRTQGDTTPGGRPIIGKIGIGLLSVGNATNRFTVWSAKENDDHIMKADVDLSPYYDKILQVESLDELKIGNVTLSRVNRTPDHPFTEVEFSEVKDPFSRDLASKAADEYYEFDWNNSTYQKFVEWLDARKITRIESLSGLSRFMFDLGLLAPTPYLPGGPVRGYQDDPAVRNLTSRLTGYDFHVFVNDIEVFKPVLFPHASDRLAQKGVQYKVYPIGIDTKLPDGRALSATGYYYHQVKRIVPSNLRGVLLRVTNVGIGSYENSFAKIYSQSPVILHQLTGELYVDKGLDSALNIDRGSFFESDEAYQRLWIEVFARLSPEPLPALIAKQVGKREPIGRDIKKRLEAGRRQAREKKHLEARDTLAHKMSELLHQCGFPEVTARSLDIKFTHGSIPKLSIESRRTSSQVKVILPHRLSEPALSDTILLLSVIELSLRRRSASEIEQRARSLLRIAFQSS